MANFFGAPGANDIRGTAEADQATLAEGTGTAFLRDGNDEVWATTNGYHIVGLGAGNDIGNLIGEGTKIGFFGAGNDQAWLNVGQVFMGDGQDFVTFVNAFNTTSQAFLGRGNDNVEGTDGQQIIGCGPEGFKTLNLGGGDDIVYSNNADVLAWLGAGKDVLHVGTEGDKEIADYDFADDRLINYEDADIIKVFDNAPGEMDVIEMYMAGGNLVRVFTEDAQGFAEDAGIEMNDAGFGEAFDIDSAVLNEAFTPSFM